MTLLLIRHGETAANAARIVQLPAESLSARGRQQARQVALRVKAEHSGRVGRIVSSDLERARMTAAAIAEAVAADVEVQPLLRERSFGALRGRPYAEIGLDIMADGYQPPAGESWEEFHRRVAAAWEWLRASLAPPQGDESRSNETTTVVVTHGLVCHSLASRHLTLPSGAEAPRRWGNTSVTSIEPRPPWRVSVLNCTLHLAAESADDRHAASGI